MRIAYLSGTFSAFSGIERQVQYQAEAAVAAGHQVTVFAFEADMKPTGEYNLVLLGMPKNLLWQRIFRLFYPFFFWSVRQQVALLKGFDQVICHQYPLTVLGAMAKKRYGATYIYFDHGVPPDRIFSNLSERVYIWLFTRLMIPSVRQADRIVCISKYLQGEMKRLTGQDAELKYDEYNHQRFHLGVEHERIRQRYHLGTRPVILYIGRISPHKNLQDLIRAFRFIDPTLQAALLIVGKRTFEGYGLQLDALATPDVIFAGYVPEEDIPSFYGAADVYATTTLWEGFDLPIVEARACGKPSVVYNIGPHPEIVQPDDVLVPAHDVQAFARALETVIRRQRNLQEVAT